MTRRLGAAQRGKLFVNAIRHARVARSLRAMPGFLPYRSLRRSKLPLLIDIESNIGMGAILSFALRIHSWAAREGIDVAVVSSSPLYSEGGDIFARYFERPATGTRRAVPHLAREWIYQNELPWQVSPSETYELFGRLFVANARLLSLLDHAAGGAAPFDLSIHFRATDKYLETGVVDTEHVLETARPYLEQASRVFLATDDAGFARTIRQRWPKVSFISYDLGEVEAGKARHFSNLSPQAKADEALVNMFLIARAPICVRTMSYLSSFVRVINPDIRTITVNRRIDAKTPFPELQLLEREL